VVLEVTDDSEELVDSIIKVERISELGTIAVISKYWLIREPHGVTSQKTVFFIVTALKT
jgi:hypothetical protein